MTESGRERRFSRVLPHSLRKRHCKRNALSLGDLPRLIKPVAEQEKKRGKGKK
jgi:hypothetical protein